VAVTLEVYAIAPPSVPTLKLANGIGNSASKLASTFSLPELVYCWITLSPSVKVGAVALYCPPIGTG